LDIRSTDFEVFEERQPVELDAIRVVAGKTYAEVGDIIRVTVKGENPSKMVKKPDKSPVVVRYRKK
jgi:ribosomal protein L14